MLETDRLYLRIIDKRHAQTVFSFIERNKSFLEPWEPLRKPEYYTLQYQLQLLANERRRAEEGSMFKVWLFAKEYGGDHAVGAISLNNIIRGVFQSCHVGYRMDHGLLNRGYMTEALAAVIDHAFHTLKLHRLEANIMPRNTASLKVVEKLGFVREGLARQYLKINGKWEDHIHMVLLNEEMAETDHESRQNQ